MQSDFGLIQSDFEKIFLCVHFNLKYDFILYEIIIYFRLELFENIYPWWDHYSFIWIGKMINVHVQNQCTDGNCVLETWSLNQSLQAGENVALLLVSWQGWLTILVEIRVGVRLFAWFAVPDLPCRLWNELFIFSRLSECGIQYLLFLRFFLPWKHPKNTSWSFI